MNPHGIAVTPDGKFISVRPGGKHVFINDGAELRTYVYDPTTRKVIHTIYLWPEPHETAFFIPGRYGDE